MRQTKCEMTVNKDLLSCRYISSYTDLPIFGCYTFSLSFSIVGYIHINDVDTHFKLHFLNGVAPCEALLERCD